MQLPVKHFKESEFACPCCGVVSMDYDFLRKLDLVRELLGFPIVPASACRCVNHNKQVGGKDDSRHLVTSSKKCDAIDVHEISRRWSLVRCCLSLGLSVGVYSWGVHIDNRPNPVLFHSKG